MKIKNKILFILKRLNKKVVIVIIEKKAGIMCLIEERLDLFCITLTLKNPYSKYCFTNPKIDWRLW